MGIGSGVGVLPKSGQKNQLHSEISVQTVEEGPADHALQIPF